MFSIFIGFVSFIVFVFFQAQGIPGGDSGDLVTAAATFGVAHPPGYPLYTLIGWLVSHIPISSVAWRIGLLSSISHAIVVTLVYLLVMMLTKRKSAAVFACLAILGNYMFFLYSVTPEVFAMFDLFVAVLTYVVFGFLQTYKIRLLVALSFVAGLSLTHHHMVIFLFPAILFVFWKLRKKIQQFTISPVWLVAAFFIGLIPYVYVYAAARGLSIVNWDNATTLANFVRLVTRADYGTFLSGAITGTLPIQRVIQIKLYMQYLLVDFGWQGVVCILVGFYWLWTKKRTHFSFFTIAILLMGPVFFFYASFPLSNRFTLATYERFLLPSYTLLFVVIGVGFAYILDRIQYYTKHMRLHRLIPGGVCVVVYLFSAAVVIGNMWKFVGYGSDRTAEYLAEDILKSLPQKSLLIVDRDTPLFTTQYVRYVNNIRQDITVLHGSMLGFTHYQSVVARVFPSLSMPDPESSDFVSQFLTKNSIDRNVFSYMRYTLEPGWYWVPHGLVYQLQKRDALSTVEQMKIDNLRLWDTFHDPRRGILSRYNHLMLSDVSDVYTSARLEFGKTILRSGDIETARAQLVAAVAYGGDARLPEAYTYLGLSELFLKRCHEALGNFAKARNLSLSVDSNLTLYESQTYQDCIGDKKKGQELFDAYIKSQRAEQTPLNKL